MISLFLYRFPFTLLFLFRCCFRFRFRFLFPFLFLFRIPVSGFSRRPTETSGATVSICEGGEKAVDRLLQNLQDRKSSLKYRLQLAQATLTSLQENSRQGLPTLINPSQTVSPARHFFNWSAGGAWCPYIARLLFINPINIRLLNRGSI